MELDKEFDKLNKLSQELSADSISVDDAVAKYTESCKIIEDCVKMLTETKGKVTILRDKIENMIEENLD